ncbi:MAG: hypothetical protein ABI577_13795, partial [bacterium]
GRRRLFHRFQIYGGLAMHRLIFVAVAGLAFAACGASEEPPQSTSVPISTTPSPGTFPEATVIQTTVPTLQSAQPPVATPAAAIVDRMRFELASRLKLSSSDLVLVSLTTMTWPDGCLGLGGPGVVCTQALVPGWLAVFRVPDGREFRFRGAGDRYAAE